MDMRTTTHTAIFAPAKILLPEYVQSALNLLENSGFEAYVVGGCVRDAMLGFSPKDWDICTSALPHQVLTCFENYRCMKTGLHHGTVTVLIGDSPIEITTYRIDGNYSDHRRPDFVSFGTSLKKDLSRRDFTINAMAWHPERGLQDPFGGARDVSAGLLRSVGDPYKRFQEDALRIMRALRFASVLGFSIDETVLEAARSNSFLLKKIAAERLYAEFCKLLCGGHLLSAINDGREIIAAFIPEIRPMFDFHQHNPHHIYDVWQHTIHSVHYSENDILLRLTMFFHDIGKPATFTMDHKKIGHFYGHTKESATMSETILRRLRADNATVRTVSELIGHHSISIALHEKAAKKWLSRLGETRMRQLVSVKKADTLAKGLRDETRQRLCDLEKLLSLIDDVIQGGKCYKLKDLAVNGHDVMSRGITDGKMVGRILNQLLKKVIDGELPNEKEALLSFLNNQAHTGHSL